MAIIHMHKAVLGDLKMFVFPMSFIKVRNLYGYISKLIKNFCKFAGYYTSVYERTKSNIGTCTARVSQYQKSRHLPFLMAT